jgi:3D (Asp-Asp-Asp) domain-containing protein
VTNFKSNLMLYILLILVIPHSSSPVVQPLMTSGEWKGGGSPWAHEIDWEGDEESAGDDSRFPAGMSPSSELHRRHPPPHRLPPEVMRVVTAYNVGDPNQNFGDPCVAASGENICDALKRGLRRCAANFVPFGTRLHIERWGTCIVTDRMHRRYQNRVDVAMHRYEKKKAMEFGRRKLRVRIIASQ